MTHFLGVIDSLARDASILRLRGCVLLAAATLSLACNPPTPPSDALRYLDADGVTALLDVMDRIGAEHPDLSELTVTLAALPDVEREAVLDDVRANNEASAAVTVAVNSLLATETYRIYFRRFTNLTPELFEDLLLDLPYRRRDAPGGTGDLFYDLVRRRHDVREAFARLLDEIDIESVYQTAEYWAPELVDERPTMHLIYDSNAGSFAAEGKPFLNVYTSIDLDSLLSESIDEAMLEAHGTMAHELHHVLAASTLYPRSQDERGWQAEWVDMVIRGLVGEGLAFHSYPPSGTLKDVYEDPDVIEALVRRFGDVLLSIRDERMTREEIQTWYRDNYFDYAESLLLAHLSKHYEGQELESQMRERISFRPDVEHALGWWMTSRISDNGARRDDAVDLLSDPYSVFRRYQQIARNRDQDPQFAPDAVAYVESLATRWQRK